MRRRNTGVMLPGLAILVALAATSGITNASPRRVLTEAGRRAIKALAKHHGAQTQRRRESPRHAVERALAVYDEVYDRGGYPALKQALVSALITAGAVRGHGRATINLIRRGAKKDNQTTTEAVEDNHTTAKTVEDIQTAAEAFENLQTTIGGLADLLDHHAYPAVGWTPAFRFINNGKLPVYCNGQPLKDMRSGVVANIVPTHGFAKMMMNVELDLELRNQLSETSRALVHEGAELVKKAYSGEKLPPNERPARLAQVAKTLGVKVKGTPHHEAEQFLTEMAVSALKSFGIRPPSSSHTNDGGTTPVSKDLLLLSFKRRELTHNTELRNELASVEIIRRHAQSVDAILPTENALATINKKMERLLANAELPLVQQPAPDDAANGTVGLQ